MKGWAVGENGPLGEGERGNGLGRLLGFWVAMGLSLSFVLGFLSISLFLILFQTQAKRIQINLNSNSNQTTREKDAPA